jgi:hypothetical protein
MSGGGTCTCRVSRNQADRSTYWKVLHRYCNYSAFNGYRRTYSAYSRVICTECGAQWRTKAGYVAMLKDTACTADNLNAIYAAVESRRQAAVNGEQLAGSAGGLP